MANFEKQALQVRYILTVHKLILYVSNNVMQVEYILNAEDKLRRVRFLGKVKKPTSKAYHEYSICEIVINRLIVFLWGGESFDSRQSNQMLLKHRKIFRNSHRVRILLKPCSEVRMYIIYFINSSLHLSPSRP